MIDFVGLLMDVVAICMLMYLLRFKIFKELSYNDLFSRIKNN